MRTLCGFCGKRMRNKPVAVVRYDVCRGCKRKARRRLAQVMAGRQEKLR